MRTVYDPAAGTGGMLTMADQRLRELNPAATVEMSGQELNPETWAIACSELMMRGVAPERMAPGNSLVDDAFRGTRFDYVLANPPYGVDWKAYADPIKAEALTAGGSNRFHAGLPRISDGSFLFLQHMISKMKPASAAGGGSRLAIVLSGSPLFSGGAGSGESEIRRWIIENDLLEGIVGLPDQMFYNTGISTYVWIVTNRKPAERAGTVTLVDARELGTKMRKSLGDKRKELTRDAIDEIARLFRDAVELNGSDARVKVMRNQDFGFARLTVERPMRRTWRVDETTTAALSPELSSAVAPLLGKSWPDEKQAADRGFGVRAGHAPDHRGAEVDRRVRRRGRADQGEEGRRVRGGRRPARPGEHPAARRLPRDEPGRAGRRGSRGGRETSGRRDPSLRSRRVDRPRQDQDRLRDPVHPPVLRLHAAPPSRRESAPRSTTSRARSRTGWTV